MSPYSKKVWGSILGWGRAFLCDVWTCSSCLRVIPRLSKTCSGWCRPNALLKIWIWSLGAAQWAAHCSSEEDGSLTSLCTVQFLLLPASRSCYILQSEHEQGYDRCFLGKNMVLTLPFQVELVCHILWTLGRHHTNIMEASYVVFFHFHFECIATTGLCCIGIRWSSFPLCNSTTATWTRQNVTRASIDKVASSKWVKAQFWVNYPFI